MGISEIEIVGSDDEDDGDFDDLGDFGDQSGDGAGSGQGSGSDSGSSSPWRRWLRPPNAPVIASLLAVVLVVAGAAFAAVQKDQSGDDFGVSLVSAQYIVRQDASGIDLTLALQNTGSTMIELTGVSVYQPGLIRMTQTDDAAGVTETEAGATTASALGPGTAISTLALTPKDVEEVTVPFRYDCVDSALPPVSRSVGLAGFSARGTARTARLTLPPGVTPWEGGDVVRSALCNQPSPESHLALLYRGEGGNTQTTLDGQIENTYTVMLIASGGAPVTVSSLSLDNPGIVTSVSPGLPRTINSGESLTVTLTWHVSNCVIATSAHSADGVKITASVRQSVQTWDATFGGLFLAALAAGISTACSGG